MDQHHLSILELKDSVTKEDNGEKLIIAAGTRGIVRRKEVEVDGEPSYMVKLHFIHEGSFIEILADEQTLSQYFNPAEPKPDKNLLHWGMITTVRDHGDSGFSAKVLHKGVEVGTILNEGPEQKTIIQIEPGYEANRFDAILNHFAREILGAGILKMSDDCNFEDVKGYVAAHMVAYYKDEANDGFIDFLEWMKFAHRLIRSTIIKKR